MDGPLQECLVLLVFDGGSAATDFMLSRDQFALAAHDCVWRGDINAVTQSIRHESRRQPRQFCAATGDRLILNHLPHRPHPHRGVQGRKGNLSRLIIPVVAC